MTFDSVCTWWGTRAVAALMLAAVSVGAAVIAFTSKGGAYGLLGFAPVLLAPLVFFLVGAFRVNERAKVRYPKVLGEVVHAAIARLGMRYRPEHAIVLKWWRDRAPMLDLPLRHTFAIVLVGDHTLGLAEGAGWDLESDRVQHPTTWREIAYDNVAQVQEINGQLYLTLHGGGSVSIIAHEGSVPAANAILARVHQRHAAASQRQPMVQHIVERQTVVMRCRYCSQLTAAELRACQSCGAMMGGA